MTADPFNRRVGGKSARLYPVDGRELPSVTTITGSLDKPALTNWLQKQVAEAAVELQDWRAMDPETAVEMLLAASRSRGRTAATKGTDVHAAVEAGTPLLELPEAHRPYVKAARHCLDELGLATCAQEVRLANLTLGYAGTADLLLFHEDLESLAILDWKTTSSTAGWREHQLQLAAYAMCDTIVDDAGDLHPVPLPITELIIVGLKADGTYDIRSLQDSYKITSLQSAFQGLLEVWELDREWPWLSIWDEATEGVSP